MGVIKLKAKIQDVNLKIKNEQGDEYLVGTIQLAYENRVAIPNIDLNQEDKGTVIRVVGLQYFDLCDFVVLFEVINEYGPDHFIFDSSKHKSGAITDVYLEQFAHGYEGFNKYCAGKLEI